MLTDSGDDYQYLKHATYGVLLLGTPHRGSDATAFGKALVYMAAALGLDSNAALLNALGHDSDELLDLVQDFGKLAKRVPFELVCYFELYNTKFDNKIYRYIGISMSFSIMVVIHAALQLTIRANFASQRLSTRPLPVFLVLESFHCKQIIQG